MSNGASKRRSLPRTHPNPKRQAADSWDSLQALCHATSEERGSQKLESASASAPGPENVETHHSIRYRVTFNLEEHVINQLQHEGVLSSFGEGDNRVDLLSQYRDFVKRSIYTKLARKVKYSVEKQRLVSLRLPREELAEFLTELDGMDETKIRASVPELLVPQDMNTMEVRPKQTQATIVYPYAAGIRYGGATQQLKSENGNDPPVILGGCSEIPSTPGGMKPDEPNPMFRFIIEDIKGNIERAKKSLGGSLLSLELPVSPLGGQSPYCSGSDVTTSFGGFSPVAATFPLFQGTSSHPNLHLGGFDLNEIEKPKARNEKGRKSASRNNTGGGKRNTSAANSSARTTGAARAQRKTNCNNTNNLSKTMGKLASLDAFRTFHELIATKLQGSSKGKRSRDFKHLEEDIFKYAETLEAEMAQHLKILAKDIRQEVKKLYGERRRKRQLENWKELKEMATNSKGDDVLLREKIRKRLKEWFECTEMSNETDMQEELTEHLFSLLATPAKNPGNPSMLPPLVINAILRQHEAQGDRISEIHKAWADLFTPADIEMVIMANCACLNCVNDWKVDEISDKACDFTVRFYWTKVKARWAANLLQLHASCDFPTLEQIQRLPCMRNWTEADVATALRMIHTRSICSRCSGGSS
mmetsp:Transcript_15520/g.28479  ORF Transcript_15520/g.28479 Transcript_15520/m.28479 type:complete len:645 (+) Transcript_15520:264-2198(+)